MYLIINLSATFACLYLHSLIRTLLSPPRRTTSVLLKILLTPYTTMSIALERSNSGGDNRIKLQSYALRDGASYVSAIYGTTEFSAADPEFPEDQQRMTEEQDGFLSSSSTSSIGKNSDESSGGSGSGSRDEEEVQSEFKGGPLDSLDALEEVLPIKRGISKFYCGKSKSFTTLSNVVSSTIKDITKPENAYTRKRKNLLAFNNLLSKNLNQPFRSCKDGISKRPTNSRSMVGIAAIMNNSGTNPCENPKFNSLSPGWYLPPLPPSRKIVARELLSPADKISSWRSFSLSDLQGVAAAEISTPDVNRSIDDSYK